MNLGFFIQNNCGTPQNTKIYKFLNEAIGDHALRDASVFFNDVGFNPVNPKFGMFDGADIWSFKGNLICTSVENLRKAVSIVNAIKVAYLFSSSDPVENNIFDFVSISKSYKVLVDNEVDQNTFYRLTGVKPILMQEWSVSTLSEVFNE